MSLHRAAFAVPAPTVPGFLDVLEGEGLAVAAFEAEPDREDTPWVVELLYDSVPDGTELQARLNTLAARLGAPGVGLSLAPVADRDWLEATRRAFPPFRINRFHVRGGHVEEPPPDDAVALVIDAGLAFGSGEHGSTRGCLVRVDRLAAAGWTPPGPVLDLGCGSGILAIAAAKLWPVPVVAADNDPRAVAVTAENARINGVADRATALESDGLGAPTLTARGPFGLILANILADPLIALAPGVAGCLAPGGLVVLAGLLDRQEDAVLEAYAAAGLRPRARHAEGVWAAPLLGREDD